MRREIRTVKIRMLGSGGIAKAVAEETEGLKRVFDPVVDSSTGEKLVDDIGLLEVLVEDSNVTPTFSRQKF